MRPDEAYEICAKKFERHMALYGDGLYAFAGRCEGGDYYGECGKADFFAMHNWTTSFITGLAPLFYQTEGRPAYLEWAERFAGRYAEKVFERPLDTTHDLGFLYMPYSAAMHRLTGGEAHRRAALKAADELGKRMSLRSGCIDAWSRMDAERGEDLMIVDCLMNLPLLFWAWNETGHAWYRDVAAAHAQTAARYLARGDFSVRHAYRFDRATGAPLGEFNACGYGEGSHWARGAAWAVYGFAVAGGYLDSAEYLGLAEKIAEAYAASLPKGARVPAWDFRLPPDLPAKMCGGGDAPWDERDPRNTALNVDASAAAIMACALYELSALRERGIQREPGARHELGALHGRGARRERGAPRAPGVWPARGAELRDSADATLDALCGEEFFDSRPDRAGMLKRQNGQMAYTACGDYFFAEALARRLFGAPPCWPRRHGGPDGPEEPDGPNGPNGAAGRGRPDSPDGRGKGD